MRNRDRDIYECKWHRAANGFMKQCCDSNDTPSSELSYDLEGLICYCFKKSKKELYDAIQANNQDQFIRSIKSQMKDPGCFCETANPSGKCCLADVKSFVVHYKE